jgi:phospholipid/cholesterol/gamma-HCH transport system substrate-binding protein
MAAKVMEVSMAENRAEIMAGAGVVVLSVGFLVYMMGGSVAPPSGSYPLTASFRSAEGIAVGTDVRLAGVKVGTITTMTLNPATYFADVGLSVDHTVQLPTDTAVLISSEGLLGGNFVELVPGGAEDILAPGDQIEDTQGSVSLISLLLKFVSGSDSQ